MFRLCRNSESLRLLETKGPVLCCAGIVEGLGLVRLG